MMFNFDSVIIYNFFWINFPFKKRGPFLAYQPNLLTFLYRSPYIPFWGSFILPFKKRGRHWLYYANQCLETAT